MKKGSVHLLIPIGILLLFVLVFFLFFILGKKNPFKKDNLPAQVALSDKEKEEVEKFVSDQQKVVAAEELTVEDYVSLVGDKKLNDLEEGSHDGEGPDQEVAEDSRELREREENQQEEGTNSVPQERVFEPINFDDVIEDYMRRFDCLPLVGGPNCPDSGSRATPTPTPSGSGGIWDMLGEPYYMIKLDKIKVHDDEDPALNGEIQIITSAISDFKEQKTATPYVSWHEANDGEFIDIDKPVFLVPEKDVGSRISLWMTVVDNDSLPEWADDLINTASRISEGNMSFFVDPRNYVRENASSRFLDWLGGEEHIGTLTTTFTKENENYGMGNRWRRQFETRQGNATFYYTILKTWAPKDPMNVEVNLKAVHGGETGDYDLWGGDGDLYIWNFVTDGFDSRGNMNSLAKRIHSSGERDLGDNDSWDIDENLLTATISGPVLYLEIGVWDKDESGNNDDQLAILSNNFHTLAYGPGTVISETVGTNHDWIESNNGTTADAEVEIEIKFSRP